MFLDRDGVLNRSIVVEGKPYAPRQLSDFRLLPRVICSVADLKTAGFFVAVVTNQPDIGNGLITSETVEAMHSRLKENIQVDMILTCPHTQNAGCECRKPKPGLILHAIEQWNIDPSQSYMIGDRWSDVVAGHAAGLYTIFVDRRYGEPLTASPDLVVRSLRTAVSFILARGFQGATNVKGSRP